MTWKELKAKALERYPITEKERTCWTEREKRNGLREEYKKRLVANNPFESGQVHYDDKREKFYEIGEIGIELKMINSNEGEEGFIKSDHKLVKDLKRE